jgi:hypothetical protein
MSRLVDSVLAYRILTLLTTPFRGTPAFKLGIIDSQGKLIREPRTDAEKDAYTLLDRLVFRVKQLLDTSSVHTDLLKRAVSLVREHYEEGDEEILAEELDLIDVTQITKYGYRSFRSLAEEGEGGVAGTTTANVQDLETEPVVSKKRQRKLLRRDTLKEAALEGELSRKELPQLSDFNAFKEDLENSGHTILARRRKTTELTPTQKHFNQEKVDKMCADGSYKSKDIITTADDYIADGHHRWKAADQVGEDIGTKQTSLTFDELMAFLEGKPYVVNKNLNEHKES